ncbi:MAG: DHH family phosphoesterase [Candidatus Gracilibacteria bacterium]|nr:DHH family phosphoesterase [Candidatus Gracilibacteria bacterium]
MDLSPKQQIKQLLDQSEEILLLTHANVDGDALGSVLSLYMVLSKLGKKVTALVSGQIPKNYSFLPNINILSEEISGSKDFIIKVDCSNAEADKLKYNLEGNKINIVITPKKGNFREEDVSFEQGSPKFDLVFIMDASNPDQTGAFYRENADLFYETPIVNIDHHITNEYFGRVNWVDVTATSTCEIVLSLIEALDEKKTLMTADIATCLLSGVISDTGSFQNANTTPKAFSVAAQLLGAGARQQEIVKYLYKTHELTTLKLWGRTLSRINYDADSKIVWSTIYAKDFEETGAKENEIAGLIDELLSSAPNAELVLLLKETSAGVVRGSMRSIRKTLDVAQMAEKLFAGGGHKRAAGFSYAEADLNKAEGEVLLKIKDYLKNEGKSLDIESKEIPLVQNTEKLVPKIEVWNQELAKQKEAGKQVEEKEETKS